MGSDWVRFSVELGRTWMVAFISPSFSIFSALDLVRNMRFFRMETVEGSQGGRPTGLDMSGLKEKHLFCPDSDLV